MINRIECISHKKSELLGENLRHWRYRLHSDSLTISTNTYCLFSFHRELDSEVVCCPQQMRLSLAFHSYCRPNEIIQCTFQNKIKNKNKKRLKVFSFHCFVSSFLLSNGFAKNFSFLLSSGLFFFRFLSFLSIIKFTSSAPFFVTATFST